MTKAVELDLTNAIDLCRASKLTMLSEDQLSLLARIDINLVSVCNGFTLFKSDCYYGRILLRFHHATRTVVLNFYGEPREGNFSYFEVLTRILRRHFPSFEIDPHFFESKIKIAA